MKNIYLLLLIFFSSDLFPQVIEEITLFTLPAEYKGNADVYNYKYDSLTTAYCYSYRIENENKSFIISGKSASENPEMTVSQKYDYIDIDKIVFDRNGNYFAITSDYKPDYGIDNYFLIINGKQIRNSDFMDSYTAYINSKGEFVYIFKDKQSYKLGFINAAGSYRESEAYENIKAIYKYQSYQFENEESSEIAISSEDFYTDETGERGFIANIKGITKIIFGDNIITTNYTDINETSLTKNNNGELSYIAKSGGKFYEKVGNEFVVSGNKEYNKFEIVTPPVLFNSSNEPVYPAGDSISENKYSYYVVLSNNKIPVSNKNNKNGKTPLFAYGISELKLTGGVVSYIGTDEKIIYSAHKDGENQYDQYYSRSYFVKNNIAFDMGYNLHQIKYSNKGDMLYSGMADLIKKEYLLMMNYGESKIILNRKKFDDIYDYGFSPNNEIYYAGINYENPETKIKNETYLYLGDELIGKYDYLSYQGEGENASVIKFDSKNNYAFVADIYLDSNSASDFVITNKGRLPFPSNAVNNSGKITYVSNLMYSKNDKLFFIADTYSDPVTFDVTKEIFVDNSSLGKSYNTLNNFKYDKSSDAVAFLASRDKNIYLVKVYFN